ncbi:MAG: hypothetical protein ACRC7C_19385 [Beijerinckiaceae bacterium]
MELRLRNCWDKTVAWRAMRPSPLPCVVVAVSFKTDPFKTAMERQTLQNRFQRKPRFCVGRKQNRVNGIFHPNFAWTIDCQQSLSADNGIIASDAAGPEFRRASPWSWRAV